MLIAGTNASARSDLQRPSMGQDMLKGRRTEIDFINGFIAEKGDEIGRPAPTHIKLIAAVKEVEHGMRPAAPETCTQSTASLAFIAARRNAGCAGGVSCDQARGREAKKSPAPRVKSAPSAPAEQAFEVGEVEGDVGWSSVIALAAVGVTSIWRKRAFISAGDR